METLAVDGSTLPGLKDLFPEHFFEHPEQTTQPQQQDTMLPQVSEVAQQQLAHFQRPRGIPFQHQSVQYPTSSGDTSLAYASQPPTRTKGSGGRRSSKRVHDAAHAQMPSHPQPQDPYHYPEGPNAPTQQFPTALDTPSQLPGVSVQAQEVIADPEVDEDVDGSPDGEKRRHPCPRCGKRFNRPSSLKIHLNTHTGAKPYVCPFQGCGRTFNVSSNMRRHFRNHARRPPPPPLPQNSIYPFPSIQASDQQDLREQSGATQINSLPQQQTLSLPEAYNNISLRGNFPDYSTQYYPPSSDERNNRAGRDRQQLGDGALITPPYTNEGDDHDPDNDVQRNFPPPMVPYNSFGPGQSDPSSMFDPSRMDMHQFIPGMQAPMGVPFEIGRAASSAFPVDPALVDRNINNDPDAEGEADADGEIDPDIDARGEENEVPKDGDVRRFGPSTSNARGSSTARSDLSPRQGQRLEKGSNATNAMFLVPPSNEMYHSLPASNTNGSLHRHPLLSRRADASALSSQKLQYSQRYNSQYTQQAQPYHHQQLSSVQDMSGMNTMCTEDPQYPVQTELPHAPHNVSFQYPTHPSQPQQYSQTSVNGHRSYGNFEGASVNQPCQQSFMGGRLSGQSVGQAFRQVGRYVNSNVTDLKTSRTPNTVPTPLHPYQPPRVPGVDLNEDYKAKMSGETRAVQFGDQDTNEDYDEDEDEESEEDSDGDDEYTGKPAPKRGKNTQRAKVTRGRGRPRGRPKSSTGPSVRGRGRPRKSAPAAIGQERQKSEETNSKIENNATSPDGMEVGGRVLRKRRRISAR